LDGAIPPFSGSLLLVTEASTPNQCSRALKPHMDGEHCRLISSVFHDAGANAGKTSGFGRKIEERGSRGQQVNSRFSTISFGSVSFSEAGTLDALQHSTCQWRSSEQLFRCFQFPCDGMAFSHSLRGLTKPGRPRLCSIPQPRPLSPGERTWGEGLGRSAYKTWFPHAADVNVRLSTSTPRY